MLRHLFLILIIVIAFPAKPLGYAQYGGTFSMDGEIKKGDFIKFLRAFASWDIAPTIFYITSKGGDVEEAMDIGNFIRLTQIPVYTGPECSSACVFIYVAGVERHVGMQSISVGKIGLHRPYFNSGYFADLESREAEKVYDDLKIFTADYLKQMGVSQAIIERMFATGSKHIDYLTESEADLAFGTMAPFYDEWLTAKCGKLTDEQSNVIYSWSNLKAARMTVAAIEDPDFQKSDKFGQNLGTLIKESQLALQLEKANMLAPYIELSKQHNVCREKAINYHNVGWHRSVKKNIVELIKSLTHQQ